MPESLDAIALDQGSAGEARLRSDQNQKARISSRPTEILVRRWMKRMAAENTQDEVAS